MCWLCFLAILSLERSHQQGEEMDQRKVVLYARSRSLNGLRAARLLRRLGCYFDVIDTRTSAPKVLAELSNAAKPKVSPVIQRSAWKGSSPKFALTEF
jgi:hypothetical protein